MLRYLPIILGTCLAVVSGLISAIGVRELAEFERLSAPPTELTIEQFVWSRPDDCTRFKLSNVRHGASVYPDPVRKDGEWEKVYVCLFSQDTWRLPKNYISVIVALEGVKGRQELGELLAKGELEINFWPNKQGLPSAVYNRMAFKYKGMQFDKCLYCESGGPPPSPDFGNSCVFYGLIGVIVSFVGVFGYYGCKVIGSIIFRERDPWYDEDEDKITNKAGLPDVESSRKKANATDKTSLPEEANALG